MADPTQTLTLRLPCSCGAVLEGESGGALLAAVETHIAAAHERDPRSAPRDDVVPTPPSTKGPRS